MEVDQLSHGEAGEGNCPVALLDEQLKVAAVRHRCSVRGGTSNESKTRTGAMS